MGRYKVVVSAFYLILINPQPFYTKFHLSIIYLHQHQYTHLNFNMPHLVSSPVSAAVMNEWARLIEKAKARRWNLIPNEERTSAIGEAMNNACNMGVSACIEKLVNSRRADPLGQRPIGYNLRVEVLREQEARRVRPWASNAP